MLQIGLGCTPHSSSPQSGEVLCEQIITSVNKRIIEQLIGASGSIGTNHCEASRGGKTKKDFIHKIGIYKKEIKETLTSTFRKDKSRTKRRKKK